MFYHSPRAMDALVERVIRDAIRHFGATLRSTRRADVRDGQPDVVFSVYRDKAHCCMNPADDIESCIALRARRLQREREARKPARSMVAAGLSAPNC